MNYESIFPFPSPHAAQAQKSLKVSRSTLPSAAFAARLHTIMLVQKMHFRCQFLNIPLLKASAVG